ncbi:hypothetical protein [Verrucosispora sioxanthis]|uniref:hypothetical protein n=1 Tax=Verrucosispora sioxanthis TaxID=2499994 RepID=UPI001C102385|nr:hypothetical protein [Verrucosispora sioxanthis]
MRKNSFAFGSASRISATSNEIRLITSSRMVTGVVQLGNASSSRRWISSPLGMSPLVSPGVPMLPANPLSWPNPVQQKRMPPTIQVAIRAPFLPRRFSSPRPNSANAATSRKMAVPTLTRTTMSATFCAPSTVESR